MKTRRIEEINHKMNAKKVKKKKIQRPGLMKWGKKKRVEVPYKGEWERQELCAINREAY